jgi:hypothetical protein
MLDVEGFRVAWSNFSCHFYYNYGQLAYPNAAGVYIHV